MTRIPRFLLSTACIAGLSLIQVTTTGQSPQPSQRDEVDLIIGERIGTPPSFAVPDCLTRTPDAATAEAARTIAQVLRDDLEFEREFRIIPRDIYRTIPVARSLEDLPFDRWQELGADGVISCTVEATSDSQIEIAARLFSVRSLESAFGVVYSGSNQNVRRYAHQLSDEIHRHQRLDELGILAQSCHGAAHGSEVHQQRHAGKILQYNSRHEEGNLRRTIGLGLPRGEFTNIVLRHLRAIHIAHHRLQHDT